VLSIHAHPDDQEFTVGGTLAKWARAGSAVITVCITSGNAGSNDYTPAEMTREALAPIREEEQRQACRVLGISEVVFLGYEDGHSEPSLALRRRATPYPPPPSRRRRVRSDGALLRRHVR
jgi:LmbE family N-acetylglucosaminyl deacetylase